MKVKKYDSYLKEGRDDYEDEYFAQFGQDDEESQSQEEDDFDDVEHLLYLLRKYLKDAGVSNADVRGNADSIKMEVVMRKEEKMTDVISVFATLRKISEEILADYDCEFDIWKTKKGEPLLIIDFYSEDAMADPF